MGLSGPPLRDPLVDAGGRITWPWLKWLQKTGGMVNAAESDAALLATIDDELGRPAEVEKALGAGLLGLLQTGSEFRGRGDIADMQAMGAAGVPGVPGDTETPKLLATQPPILPFAPGDQDAQKLLWALTDAPSRRGAAGSVIIDTHANRLANYPAAANTKLPFFETDRTVFYVSDGTNWLYIAGQWSGTQATLPADLGASDAGFLGQVTDFGHTLRWGGAAWGFIPGDGSFYFVQAPGTPIGGVWGLCDGTTYSYLKADGTTANFVTPNASAHYMKATSAGYGGVQAAGGVSEAKTAGTPAGTNSAPGFTGNAAAGQAVTVAGAGSGVVAPYTPSGSVDAPVFTGVAMATHVHGPATLELARVEAQLWFRR